MSMDDKLESAIMSVARETRCTVYLSFLVELQRHIVELREQMGTHEELFLTFNGEVNEIINDMDRGALVDVERIRQRLADLTAYEGTPEE